MSVSSTFPVLMIANSPEIMPVGFVSASKAATLLYVFAIIKPKPVSPCGPCAPVEPGAPISPCAPLEPGAPASPWGPCGPILPAPPEILCPPGVIPSCTVMA